MAVADEFAAELANLLAALPDPPDRVDLPLRLTVGDLDLAIAIRTLVCKGDTFEVTAGAGIVEASDPQAQADETRNKARGVLCAIEAAPQAR